MKNCSVCGKEMKSKKTGELVTGMKVSLLSTNNVRVDENFLKKQIGAYKLNTDYLVCVECLLRALGVEPDLPEFTEEQKKSVEDLGKSDSVLQVQKDILAAIESEKIPGLLVKCHLCGWSGKLTMAKKTIEPSPLYGTQAQAYQCPNCRKIFRYVGATP